MNIVIGADKGGFAIKNALIPYLEEKGHHVIDVGTTDLDNPRSHNITGIAAAEAIREGRAERGILICGTGMGMS
nr:RpiB/LacA/LacB family sugar-phosphate isomerase [Clostridia bacterium]